MVLIDLFNQLKNEETADGDHSAIKADEVPDIPTNRFLHRRSTTPDEVVIGVNQ